MSGWADSIGFPFDLCLYIFFFPIKWKRSAWLITITGRRENVVMWLNWPFNEPMNVTLYRKRKAVTQNVIFMFWSRWGHTHTQSHYTTQYSSTLAKCLTDADYPLKSDQFAPKQRLHSHRNTGLIDPTNKKKKCCFHSWYLPPPAPKETFSHTLLLIPSPCLHCKNVVIQLEYPLLIDNRETTWLSCLPLSHRYSSFHITNVIDIFLPVDFFVVVSFKL